MGVGENIKNKRKMAGLSQKDLGLKLGVSDKTICSWEINRTEPNIEMIDLLCEYLHCTRNELVHGYRKEDLFSSENAVLLTLVATNTQLLEALKVYFDLPDNRKQKVIDFIYLLKE